ncbi:MAG TPA: hypothetical protein VE988_09735, partial [Gemmataceae bacterium]|nr:hypothetical protein [Gemmataceae bacterium]
TLAKKYGITTPYTSYLVVPDTVSPGFGGIPDPTSPPALKGIGGAKGGAGDPAAKKGGAGKKGGPPPRVDDLAKQLAKDGKKGDELRKELADQALKDAAKAGDKKAIEQLAQQSTYAKAQKALDAKDRDKLQQGTLGVDISIQVDKLRSQTQTTATTVQRVANRSLVDIGGVWIDDGFDAKTKTITIKAQSDAYFRLLEKQPSLSAVFRLGNHLVYVTPSGDALVIDSSHGEETLADAEIDRLFVAPKKK